MLKWLNVKNFIICFLLLIVTATSVALPTDALYTDKTRLISQQTELLKNRLLQAQNQFNLLERQEENSLPEHLNDQIRNQAALDVSVAKSNVDSINIELSESDQALSRQEKDIQEVENQLNVFSIFGVKIAPTETLNIEGLRAELNYQKSLLALEKDRESYLSQLQQIAGNILQLQKQRYIRVNAQLKSQAIMQLKERQAQSEAGFQQQQSYWLQQLNKFYTKLNALETSKNKDKNAYSTLQREIFYANENLNSTYLQMLIVRYQDQLAQLKIATAHNSTITLLNKTSDQVQLLSKQLVQVTSLLQNRVEILQRHKNFLAENINNNADDKLDLNRLLLLSHQYENITLSVSNLEQNLRDFRVTLDKALQVELSSRQGLPGLNAKAWLDLGAEIWMVPSLTYQMVKSLTSAVGHALQSVSLLGMSLLLLLEIGLLMLFSFANKLFVKAIAGMAKQELGHINLKRLCIQVLRRNLIDIFVIGNLFGLMSVCNIPAQTYELLANLAMVWVFFKMLITMARVLLVETAHDKAGHDVILYHRLKWSFLVGGVITALTVLIHQLPVIYEVKDLFNRLFLSFLLVVSIFLLRSWEVLPDLILPHIDDQRLYFKRIVRMLGMLIPLILLTNTAIGLFGFVNLVLTISWYESIFVLVLAGYLVIRGLMIDSMVYLSNLIIRHVVNGWLWTEAILKPLDKVLRITLFFASWAMLFFLYGWNQQSPVVMGLNSFLHYHIADVFNTSITLLSIIEIGVIVSILFWAARWTREFVYRMLSTRTKDMGLRNSIAIFSQYTVIVIGIFICLRVVGIDFRALAVVAGAFAFGVGLGLRDLFNNFACGFLLLIERPLRVGDTVTIAEYEGEVMHIGGRAVTVRTWDHMDVLVPNAEIFSKSFTNWTGKDHIVRTVAAIKINRHDSPHVVQSIIYNVLASHKDVLSEPVSEVLLKELSDSLIEFEVRYFINLRQVRSRLVLRSEVLLAIWDAFEKNGIQPPYPQHEVHMRNPLPHQPLPDRGLAHVAAVTLRD
jgi:potassium-dependent mechanosensitive channel